MLDCDDASRRRFLNLPMNMSVDCGCAGMEAARPGCPELGMLASAGLDAVERASVDMVCAMPEQHRKALSGRIAFRKGLRQLIFMKAFGMGDGTCELARM